MMSRLCVCGVCVRLCLHLCIFTVVLAPPPHTTRARRDRPHVSMVPADKNASRVAFEGWITAEGAKHLLALCGQDYETLKQRAHTRQHRSVELAGARLSMTIRNQVCNLHNT